MKEKPTRGGAREGAGRKHGSGTGRTVTTSSINLPPELWNAALHENAVLRGAMARLCRAVSRRMMPDEPTPEDRMELREAFDAASDSLLNADVEPPMRKESK